MVAETALLISVLVLFAIGVIEFGWLFFALHMVTNAARDGARAAASLQNRGTCGDFINTSTIGTLVTNELAGVATVDGSAAGGCCPAGVCVQQCNAASDGTVTCPVTYPSPPCHVYTGDPIPVVKVTVAGHISDVFRLFGGAQYSFCRAVTFRDDNRKEQ